MHRRLDFLDAAWPLLAAPAVARDHVDALDHRAPPVRQHAQHLAALAPVAPGQHRHPVALANARRHHSTSGASEMIFMKRLARSSRVTGPKMRVPTGSFCGLRITAALRSKRIAVPSGRVTSLRVRTTTARRISPLRTRPRGIASFTDTMMMSPTEAVRRPVPPSTRMHCTRRAPELSATSRLVSTWIMPRSPRRRAPRPGARAPASACAARSGDAPRSAPRRPRGSGSARHARRTSSSASRTSCRADGARGDRRGR